MWLQLLYPTQLSSLLEGLLKPVSESTRRLCRHSRRAFAVGERKIWGDVLDINLA
jgi:hypothetical protein